MSKSSRRRKRERVLASKLSVWQRAQNTSEARAFKKPGSSK